MPLKPCLDCGKPTPNARCADHDTDTERRVQKSKDHGLFHVEWRGPNGLRKRALDRDQGLCKLRVDDRCTTLATTVHLDPALEGDHARATLDDCTSACAHCHGVIDGARAARATRTQQRDTLLPHSGGSRHLGDGHSPASGSILTETRPLVIM